MAGKSHDFTLQRSSYGKNHLVFCIISDERVYSSKSPEVFNQVMRRAGINGTYVPFMVQPEKIGDAMISLRALNIAGANVTVPYKESVAPYMDSVSESAEIIGAINTIARNKDKLKGYNTNAIALMDALDDIPYPAAGKTALVLGAGGAAKAAAFVLQWLKAGKIFVAGRSEARARQVAVRAGGEFLVIDDLLNHKFPIHLLINATTASSPEESPELADIAARLSLPHCELIYDLNYGRINNIWRDKALQTGAMFRDGLLTLVHQARNSLSLWTGIEIETDAFRKALEEAG